MKSGSWACAIIFQVASTFVSFKVCFIVVVSLLFLCAFVGIIININIGLRYMKQVQFFLKPQQIRYQPHAVLHHLLINPLTSKDAYIGRTAPLTSKCSILYIYSTNTGTEYFKHGIYSTFFFSSKCSLFHNCNVFGSCIIHILYTVCAKI